VTNDWQDIVAPTLDVARSSLRKDDVDVVATAGRLGFLGLGVPEDCGGSGATCSLAGSVVEVAGAGLAHGTLLHQYIATYALWYGDAGIDDVTAAADGSRHYLVAFDRGITVGETLLSVPFGIQPHAVVHVGKDIRVLPAEGVVVDLVDGGWLNPNSLEARVEVGGGRGLTLARGAEQTRAVANGLSSMYAIGVATRLLEDTVTYAKERSQFGVPIGSFQAIKHHLSNAFIALQHARALAVAGLDEIDDGNPAATHTVALGKHLAGTATQAAAELCLQVFGGIGFTWESPVHEHLKSIIRLRQWPMTDANLRDDLQKDSRRQ
jgi:alkylation response protein AidB-like acyl-CoA dehydrogenase